MYERCAGEPIKRLHILVTVFSWHGKMVESQLSRWHPKFSRSHDNLMFERSLDNLDLSIVDTSFVITYLENSTE